MKALFIALIVTAAALSFTVDAQASSKPVPAGSKEFAEVAKLIGRDKELLRVVRTMKFRRECQGVLENLQKTSTTSGASEYAFEYTVDCDNFDRIDDQQQWIFKGSATKSKVRTQARTTVQIQQFRYFLTNDQDVVDTELVRCRKGQCPVRN